MKEQNVYTALLEAQKNIGAATKGAENPFFKSNYADLSTVMEVVKKPLNDAGLSVTQQLEIKTNSANGAPYNTLVTAIRDDKGCSISSEVLVPEVKDIQKLGAAITYLKRYALQALLFVPTEDDDGNSVTGKTTTKSKTVKKVTTQQFPF